MNGLHISPALRRYSRFIVTSFYTYIVISNSEKIRWRMISLNVIETDQYWWPILMKTIDKQHWRAILMSDIAIRSSIKTRAHPRYLYPYIGEHLGRKHDPGWHVAVSCHLAFQREILRFTDAACYEASEERCYYITAAKCIEIYSGCI